jgi:hypothetical protein
MYHPFQPHALARLRLSAYMKNVVMEYIDNLIAWGDQLFRRDTIESINEATLLYVLAANIMGPKPQRTPPRSRAKPETYASLKDKLNLFSNAIVSFENHFPFASSPSTDSAGPDASGGLLGLSRTLYFCTPQNDKLLGYWDIIADRLFKIRHCMNIEGVVRELPLFEPPIDPALLVRAAAAGVDLSSVLNDINAPLPHYRYTYMLQKAIELCAEVKALGAALLTALEKKDAEALALLRSEHEVNVLVAVKEIKKNQLDEASATLEGLKKYQDVVTARQQYYLNRPGRIPEENEHLRRLDESIYFQLAQQEFEAIAAILHLLPDFKTGSLPTIGATYGGSNVAPAVDAFGRSLGTQASKVSTQGSISSTKGGYIRRGHDWSHQADLATKELLQVEKQIAAADIRVKIAEKELQNHETQIENAQAIDEFMRNKFTNEELFTWHIGEISKLYFQTYKLAYDVAKRVERTFRHELGLRNSNFIQFGYWDSLKKGLLAGEKLHHDLKRMEMAYLDQNKREYEITKNISLMLHDPLALIALKETGQCQVELPEALLDADYPGHYMRRIKSISLTPPCVVGPYTSINCTLTLLSNKTRIKSSPTEPYPEMLEEEDARFVTNFAAMQSIATSHAQNDSGLFELNFRDERYVPFEGAGTISRWRIELPKENNAFDFNTLSDVVLHLKYTAREGGESLKKAARSALELTLSDTAEPPLVRIFSAKHEFPGEWHQFLHPHETDNKQTLDLALLQERFPFQFRGKTISIHQVEAFLKFKDLEAPNDRDHKTYAALYAQGPKLQASLSLTSAGDDAGSSASAAFANDPRFNGLPHLTPKEPITAQGPAILQLVATDDNIAAIDSALHTDHNRLKMEAIEDIVIVCHYSVEKSPA